MSRYVIEEEDEDVGNFPLITSAGSSFDKGDLNADLAQATLTAYNWQLAGYEAIRDVLNEYELNLPEVHDLDTEMSEMVYQIEGTELFLYLFYERDDEGKYEFFAEVVNEKELDDVLDEIDVGENDDDDDDVGTTDDDDKNDADSPYYKDDD